MTDVSVDDIMKAYEKIYACISNPSWIMVNGIMVNLQDFHFEQYEEKMTWIYSTELRTQIAKNFSGEISFNDISEKAHQRVGTNMRLISEYLVQAHEDMDENSLYVRFMEIVHEFSSLQDHIQALERYINTIMTIK